jgi:hypothetical protein
MSNAEVLNPFDVLPSEELPHAPVMVRNWTEYFFFFAYDIATGYGVNVHIGREPTAPDIWRGTLGIFLPKDELLVAKYCGSDGSARGAGAGPLQFRCVEPLRTWSADFRGLVQSRSRNAALTSVACDSLTEMASFKLTFEGFGPVWDLEKALGGPKLILDPTASATEPGGRVSHHWEQIGRVHGEISCRGETISVNAVGIRDHSYGPRDYTPIVGSAWSAAMFPDGSVVMAMAMELSGHDIKVGYLTRGPGEPIEIVEVIESPPLNGTGTLPRSVPADLVSDAKLRTFRWVLKSRRGEETLEGELLHAMPVTLVAPGHELLGTDLDRADRSWQMADCPARYQFNGKTGAGVRERIARISVLRP